MLGYTSEFPVRSLERQGRLTPVRGAMGQAWYPRADVLRLRSAVGPGTAPVLASDRVGAGAPEAAAERRPVAARCSDAELVGLLRQPVAPEGGGPARPRTPVDLVADAGIGIARATRVYRFWLTHDLHPTAELARRHTPPRAHRGEATVPEGLVRPGSSADAVPAPRPVAVDVGRTETSRERRGEARREREILIRDLRDPDPAVRARAFERLRPRPAAP